MVQSSLNTYFRDLISPIGCLHWNPDALAKLLGTKKGKSWFVRYRLLFLEDLGIDWTKGPVALTDLEQLNLTRDDLIHNVDMMSFSIKRDEKHAARFPSGLFTDELWRGLNIERLRIDKKATCSRVCLGKRFLRVAGRYPLPISAVLQGH